MIDFSLTPEQQLLRTTVKEVLASVCPIERVRDLEKAGVDIDERAWEELRALGCLDLATEIGGLAEAAIVSEQIGGALTPLPFVEHIVGARALGNGDSGGAISLLSDNELVIPIPPLGEASLRVDDAGLHGTTGLIPYAEAADYLVVAAGTLPSAGIFVVDCRDVPPPSPAGRSIGGALLAKFEFDGTTANALTTDAESMVTDAWILAAASWLGSARAALALTVAYVKERHQFGRSIGSFQAVQFELARMEVDTTAALLVTHQAAAARDAGRPDASRLAAESALLAADGLHRCARAAVQFHGGYGFTMEYDPQIYFRRANQSGYRWGRPEQVEDWIATSDTGPGWETNPAGRSA